MKVSSGIKCSVRTVNIVFQCFCVEEVEDDRVVGLVASLVAMIVLVMAMKRKQNFQ